MFGQGGSSQITGSSGFDLGSFDDVLWLEKIMLTGTITRAELSITFLETLNSRASGAESFFDFSGGFEDFALLSTADAVLLEEAAIGLAAAPSGVTYATTESATEAIIAAAPTPDPVPTPDPTPKPSPESAPTSDGATFAGPPAAPAPPWVVFAGLAVLLLLKPRKPSAHESK
jgi:hypothetical protein